MPNAQTSQKSGQKAVAKPKSGNGAKPGRRGIDSRTGKIGVFVSHKSEDREAAIELKRIIDVYSAKRLDVFVSANIPAGDDWRKSIKEHLLNSNVLILLFTDPRDSWDWCLFEAGLFVDLKGEDFRRVVCIHHPSTDRPHPLEHLQSVEATQESLEDFIAEFFGETTIIGGKAAINPTLAKDPKVVTDIAAQVTSMFHPMAPWFPHMRVVLSFDASQVESLRQTNQIPEDVVVSKAGTRALAEVFGLGQGNYEWVTLSERSNQRGDSAWIGELGYAMVRASHKEINEIHLSQTFRSARGGTIFRPLLYRIDFVDTTPSKFHVLFTEEGQPAEVAGAGTLAAVFQMLKVGHRFRWEVLKSYQGNMRELARQIGDADACRRLREVISVVEEEVADMGLLEPTVLTAPFPEPEDRARMEALLQRWQDEIRTPLFAAMESGNVDTVEEFLKSLRRANREFIAICGKRYAELAEIELEEEQA